MHIRTMTIHENSMSIFPVIRNLQVIHKFVVLLLWKRRDSFCLDRYLTGYLENSIRLADVSKILCRSFYVVIFPEHSRVSGHSQLKEIFDFSAGLVLTKFETSVY